MQRRHTERRDSNDVVRNEIIALVELAKAIPSEIPLDIRDRLAALRSYYPHIAEELFERFFVQGVIDLELFAECSL